MRPIRSFLLLLIFLACFTGLYYFFPANQFFPSVYEFIPEKILTPVLQGIDNQDLFFKSTISDTARSIAVNSIVHSDSLLQFTVIDTSYGLGSFLDTLRYSKGQVRVMYYGDSQIEGDRITSYLRQTLRERSGGKGPGLLLPLMPVMYTKTVWMKSSSNWTKYSYLSYKAGEITHNELGPFMAFCRFLPEGIAAKEIQTASVRIRPSNLSDSASSEYDILRIFYGHTQGPVNVTVWADDNKVFTGLLAQGSGFREISCRLNGSKDINIEFTGKVSPDIYGLSIESTKGVILDNIPQRGSAGLEFTMVDKENLKEAYEKLSPDLIILHYGLNIVKNIRNDYSYFRKGLARQLNLIKEISPSSKILVISLTDMAAMEGDSIKAYVNIPSIIEAQRRASFDAGVAFWDSYTAMGGGSSIIEWADRKPALAQKDYVHLTYPGADTLSKILATALFSGIEPDTTRLRSKIAGADSLFVPRIPDEMENTGEIIVKSLLRYNPDKPMIFTTAAFWLFFLIVLAGYSIVYKKLFIRNLYLFLLSLFFYYKSGGLFLSLLIFVTLVDYTCGLLIHRSGTKFMRRIFILLSVISNLGILAWFKYTGFFVSMVNDLLGTDYQVYDFLAAFSNSHLGTSFNISDIVLPVGISFFTFQSLSYTFDVYRKKIQPVRNVIDFGFYVSFFPQLVAGPIVRASEFIPQLYTEFHLAKREFSHALFLISKGLIKKIVISDFIATSFVDRVFDAPSVYSGFENLMAVYGYGLQIYCDFSGYTDIAIGVALILGFRLPLNFNSPYKAAGMADFWKRWHISLSRWLKDYLYIPLGGNRKGKIRTNINLLITMLLGGLWHGADLRFIIWGLLHGLGLVFERIWKSIFGDRLTQGKIGRAVVVFITFQFVSFCWIFFRAPDTESIKIMFSQIFNSFSPGSYLTVLPAYSSVFLLIAVGYTIHFLPESFKESYRGLFIRIPMAFQLLLVMIVALLLYQMKSADTLPFIYFRF
jgi:D-alanyl-lipoteichoic acid acyltransferase DltB (MBOAT superfamily)